MDQVEAQESTQPIEQLAAIPRYENQHRIEEPDSKLNGHFLAIHTAGSALHREPCTRASRYHVCNDVKSFTNLRELLRTCQFSCKYLQISAAEF